MNQVKKCEECGADTEYRVEGSTEGFFCTKCDWALVTTRIPTIAQDITKYRIYLVSADQHNKEQVKVIADVANINFLQARKLVQEEKPVILQGEAVEIDKARNLLNDVNVEYIIEPNFPY